MFYVFDLATMGQVFGALLDLLAGSSCVCNNINVAVCFGQSVLGF